jgi:uncharacterized protein (TIGR02466 family)
MSKLDKLFAVPVYDHTPNESEIDLIQKEIFNAWNLIEKDLFLNPVEWKDGVQTNIFSTLNTIEKFNLLHLKSYIELHLYQYTNTMRSNFDKTLFLQTSWINITKDGQYQNSHQHKDAVISGVYYYQTTGNDGDLVFETPNPYIDLELFPYGYMCNKTISYTPRAGKLILFPGWLKHRVEPNVTKDPRISISFNFLSIN